MGVFDSSLESCFALWPWLSLSPSSFHNKTQRPRFASTSSSIHRHSILASIIYTPRTVLLKTLTRLPDISVNLLLKWRLQFLRKASEISATDERQAY